MSSQLEKNVGDGAVVPGAESVDFEVPQLRVQDLKWDNDQNIQKSISALYQYAEATADDAINWYGRHKRKIAWKSRALRMMAIIFTTFGGLAPIIGSLGVSNVTSPGGAYTFNVGQLGYLFLGLAAACVGLDRFFGFSSGWMRYITTKMTLERSLSEFRMDWAMMVAKIGEEKPTSDQVQLMIQRLKEFLLKVDSHVEQETEAWVSEFKTNITEIEKTARTQADATRPGAISVTVTNGRAADDGFTVALDGMVITKVRGTQYQIGYVPPGPHRIDISGVIEGESLDASGLANVAPGEITNVTLAFPVQEAQP